MKRKLIVAFMALCCVISFANSVKSQNVYSKEAEQKLISALQIISLAYVDTVNSNKLTEAAIEAMLKKLDPHSVYVSKEEVEKMNEPLVGNFDGIGVQFNLIKDTIVVVTPTPDGPSEKVGIMSGDKIVTIDGVNSTGEKINTDYVVKHLRGVKGTVVKVGIYRKGKPGILEFSVTRDKIPINSVDATYMLTPEIGYIKLNKFAAQTMEEFHEAMRKLRGKGMKSLVLDLRDNSGGYLNTAIDLADEFLKEGKTSVYTEGNASPKQISKTTSKGSFEKGKLVILINEGSASASEIVSGAIQDWDRGLIIGRRSFGKGLVQRPFNLPDGSLIRLTTAHYYTPSGRCVQKPYDEGTDKYFKDLSQRYKNGELMHADSIKFPDSLKFYTAKHRLVYGGGGIMPDIFMPLDTSRISDYYTDLLRKGIFNTFVMSYLDGSREDLKNKYPSIEEFNKNFVVDNTLIAKFMDFGEKEGVKKNEAEFKTSEKYITNFLKAWIARNLWDYEAYWVITNQEDEVVQKAISSINDAKTFENYKIDY